MPVDSGDSVRNGFSQSLKGDRGRPLVRRSDEAFIGGCHACDTRSANCERRPLEEVGEIGIHFRRECRIMKGRHNLAGLRAKQSKKLAFQSLIAQSLGAEVAEVERGDLHEGIFHLRPIVNVKAPASARRLARIRKRRIASHLVCLFEAAGKAGVQLW